MSKAIKHVECAYCGEVVGDYYVTCPYCGYRLVSIAGGLWKRFAE